MLLVGCSIEFENIGGPDITRDGAPRFERDRRVPPNFELQFDNHLCVAKRGVDVTIFLPDDRGLGGEVGQKFARIDAGIDHGRQRIYFGDNQIRGILREIGALREDHRDRVPDISYATGCQDRLPIWLHAGRLRRA